MLESSGGLWIILEESIQEYIMPKNFLGTVTHLTRASTLTYLEFQPHEEHFTNSPPTLIGAGQQWTIPPSRGHF